MALSFTERFRYSAGGRAFLYLDVLMDATTSTFTAASVGLTYLDFAGTLKWGRTASQAASTSALIGYTTISVISEGTKVEIGVPMISGVTKRLLLIGW